MTEMIERVARAICPELDALPDGRACSDQKGWWIQVAGEAIAAMREPTDDMFQAGETAAKRFCERWSMSIADEVFTAMIDAALPIARTDEELAAFHEEVEAVGRIMS